MTPKKLPYPNEVLSKFREGLDTIQIAKHFEITEAQAYWLLDEARQVGFHIGVNPSSLAKGRARGARASQMTSRKRIPITLPTFSILHDEGRLS